MENAMTRAQIKELNAIAQADFKTADAMLKGINLVLGTKYDWLNRRVVYWENGVGYHDAWACAKN